MLQNNMVVLLHARLVVIVQAPRTYTMATHPQLVVGHRAKPELTTVLQAVAVQQHVPYVPPTLTVMVMLQAVLRAIRLTDIPIPERQHQIICIQQAAKQLVVPEARFWKQTPHALW